MLNMCANLGQGKVMKRFPIKLSVHYLTTFKLLIVCSISMLISACGSSQHSLKIARQTCRKGADILKHRIGPEFSRFVSITPLPLSRSKYGCTFVYTKILEELPGEVVGSYVSATEPHELAFVIPDYEGRLILNQPSRPKYRRGPVTMAVKLAEIRLGAPPEIIVEEREVDSQSPIYSMRIFMYADGVPVPKEIFAERLSARLNDGREKELEWLIADIEGFSAIILKDKISSNEKVYMWHESLQSYQYDLAVTQRRKLSPNAAQLHLNSKKDLRPKVIKPLHSAAQLPKSLVTVIESDQEKMKTKSNSQQSGTSLKSQNMQETPPKSKKSHSRPRENNEKVTTVDEFLEGL